MADRNTTYRAVMVMLVAIGLAATAVGFGGLYVVLTGGTVDDPAEVDVLGEYDCQAFDGDPEVKHETSYQIERTLVGGSQIRSFDASHNESHLRIEIEPRGRLLGASGSRPDGTAVPVRQLEGGRLVVSGVEPAPLRVWIDVVSNESSVTRTELDICPPG